MINPANLAEAEVEPKATAMAPQVEELRVLLLHSVTELNFREAALECLGEIVQLESDYAVLLELTNRCEALQNAILDVVAPGLPVLDLGVY